jgi:hypothetical protein
LTEKLKYERFSSLCGSNKSQEKLSHPIVVEWGNICLVNSFKKMLERIVEIGQSSNEGKV